MPRGTRRRTGGPGVCPRRSSSARRRGELEDPGIGAGETAVLEPVEHLCRRIDLVVVPAIGKDRHLVQVLREPRCLLGHPDKAVLDHREPDKEGARHGAGGNARTGPPDDQRIEFRRRLEYPQLKRAVPEQYERFRPSVVLIEDKASATQLIQELTREGLYAVTRYKPQSDKVMRMHAQTAMIENGFVRVPEKAPWLA